MFRGQVTQCELCSDGRAAVHTMGICPHISNLILCLRAGDKESPISCLQVGVFSWHACTD